MAGFPFVAGLMANLCSLTAAGYGQSNGTNTYINTTNNATPNESKVRTSLSKVYNPLVTPRVSYSWQSDGDQVTTVTQAF